MGLKLKKRTGFGVDAEYFKIGKVEIDFLSNNATITVYGYLVKNSTDAPLSATPYFFEFTDANNPFDSKDVLTSAYKLVKSSDDFKQATDVIEKG